MPYKKELAWDGGVYGQSGYDRFSRNTVLRLAHHHGWTIKLKTNSRTIQVPRETAELLRVLENNRIDESAAPIVYTHQPYPVSWPNHKIIWWTMFESLGCPPAFREAVNQQALECWNPSHWGCEVFKQGGMVPPLIYMPLGVDVNIYRPGLPDPELSYQDLITRERVKRLPAAFRYIAVFAWQTKRKGQDHLISAFCRSCFNQDAILVIYTRFPGLNPLDGENYVRNYVNTYISEHGEPEARIYHCGQVMTDEEAAGVFANANCYVSASKGEGFNMPVVESGACGVPVVAFANTATSELVKPDCGLFVDTPHSELAGEEWPQLAPWFKDQQVTVVDDGEVNELSEKMRFALTHPAAVKLLAENMRRRVLANFTWDQVAQRVNDRLELILSRDADVWQTAEGEAYGA